ncbi:NmrA-like family protein [Aureobasidium namibiae CBS 147.97]|uniref:NmrA-like family protein n=1 Tax=Aureobasidium namibiae CBS 147.97 TaxID=1043004 RepID=A0A074W755_9PEZI
MASPTVIVFGPTGNVARVAAITARKHGAQVVLAMRDPSKEINGIRHEENGYERVQADLTKPDTIREAVLKTGAKKAFIYQVHSSDHLKSSIEALKEAGIDFVVFMSSFTIVDAGGDLEAISPKEHIPYSHARVELSLLEVFGREHFVPIRSGSLATNLMMFNGQAVRNGHVSLWAPESTSDCISADDLGEVAGTVLVNGSDKKIIYLFGPEPLSQQKQIETVARVLQKDIKIDTISTEAEAVEAYKAKGLPEAVARLIAANLAQNTKSFAAREPQIYREGVSNVKEITGHPSTSFQDFVSSNSHLFQ